MHLMHTNDPVPYLEAGMTGAYPLGTPSPQQRQAGKAGLTHALLDEIGSELRARELLRLDVLPSSGLHPKFLAFALPQLLDCSIVRLQGNTLTLFRYAYH